MREGWEAGHFLRPKKNQTAAAIPAITYGEAKKLQSVPLLAAETGVIAIGQLELEAAAVCAVAALTAALAAAAAAVGAAGSTDVPAEGVATIGGMTAVCACATHEDIRVMIEFNLSWNAET